MFNPSILARSIHDRMRVAAELLGKRVTLQRGDTQAENVPALRGSGEDVLQQTDVEGGPTLTVHVQHWLILREDYDFGSGPVEPRRGDRIIATDDHGVYEVLDLPGTPAVSLDELELRWRIRTKRVA